MKDDDPVEWADHPPVDEALDVWCDLERALAGKNGYGGDVAEIYAYRLLPGGAQTPASDAAAILAGKNMTRILRRFVDRHHAHVAIDERAGFRALDLATEEFSPFGWRVHLRVTRDVTQQSTPSVAAMREMLDETTTHLGVLSAMLDELAAHRGKQSLGVDAHSPADVDDLPPDGPTGLYLDQPFAVDDLAWIKMAWDAMAARGDGGTKRADQLMLVFQAIRRDARATAEFLRVMNTIVLPILRRLRLRDQPQIAKIGAVGGEQAAADPDQLSRPAQDPRAFLDQLLHALVRILPARTPRTVAGIVAAVQALADQRTS